MQQLLPGLWEIDEIGDAVHCYLWEWAGGLTLIDTGMPADAPKVIAALLKQGYALHNVRRILITHADIDHTGGLAHIKKVTGAKVACHVVEKELLEHPNRRQPVWYLRPLFGAVVALSRNFQVQPVTPDELLVDGQELAEGFTVVHTPGHTPGHISLLHKAKRFLIAGDALANRKDKLSGPASLFTPDMKNAQRSIWKLAKKYGDDFDAVVFGHGTPLLHNGDKRIKAMASQIFSADV
jgi:glyoxylase-like metal-dependent hydrolase (beta-lactamase superfamily II)